MAEESRLTHSGADVARLRADIEHTRAALGDTLSQIQERLNPERLKEQARETVREATIGRVKKMARNAQGKASDAGRGVGDVIRDNPLPLALIGLGAGWLWMNSRRRSQVDYQNDRLLTERTPVGYEGGYSYDTANRSSYNHPEGFAANTGHQPSGYSSAGSAAGAGRARDTVHDVREQVSDAGEAVRSAAGNVVHRVSDTASGVVDRVRSAAGSVASGARSRQEETPWYGAALAIGLGVAAGYAIPGTERENQLMGDKRNELVGRAREAGREKLNAVRNVASDVAADARDTLAAAKDTARETLVNAKETLRESVKEHAREEGLVSSNQEEIDGMSSSGSSGSSASSASGGTGYSSGPSV